jgi:alkanesulfonate monooxygenase SsuD/methylene tetrahydromethanopterin reductase-like flavin-dependent oxidoreductase (luciferase family)
VTGAPLAAGSISLRLYPHTDLDPPAVIAELSAQAARGAAAGFDGVMTSEHHAGFAGYLPNPLQVAGWCLEEMATGWAAPCPLLLTLRPPALVAEETAWLNIRFPGRVGLGVAAGALRDDFEVMGLTMRGLAERFTEALEQVVAALRGDAPEPLARDAALMACREHPIPVISAAMGAGALRRAARLGVGILFDSMSSPERCRELSDAYRDAGGTGPCIAVRRAWVGEPPRERLDAQLDVYRGYTPAVAQAHWLTDEVVADTDPTAVADGLAAVIERAGIDALNFRVHVPGVTPAMAREQIDRIGHDVIPALRARAPFTR